MRIPIRIYYEDTDCGGVVYYANYLKYFERGRTEYLRALGVPLSGLLEKGVVFVVVRVEAEYLRPCRYDDLITLDTSLLDSSRATVTFAHAIRKEGSEAELVRGTVTLAAVGSNGRPMKLPQGLKEALLKVKGDKRE